MRTAYGLNSEFDIGEQWAYGTILFLPFKFYEFYNYNNQLSI